MREIHLVVLFLFFFHLSCVSNNDAQYQLQETSERKTIILVLRCFSFQNEQNAINSFVWAEGFADGADRIVQKIVAYVRETFLTSCSSVLISKRLFRG